MLRVCGSGALVASSGCLGVLSDSESDDERLFCDAEVFNDDDADHDVRMRLTEGDETRHEARATLGGYDGTGSERETQRITAEDLPSPNGDFVLQVRVDAADWETVDLTSGLAEPVSVIAIIRDGTPSFYGSQDPDLTCQYLTDVGDNGADARE